MSIKRRVRVTIEKEFDIELTDKMFGNMSEEEYIKEFSKFLWKIENINGVVDYAARMAADNGVGYSHDAIGLIRYQGNKVEGDVLVSYMDEEFEVDITKEY